MKPQWRCWFLFPTPSLTACCLEVMDSNFVMADDAVNRVFFLQAKVNMVLQLPADYPCITNSRIACGLPSPEKSRQRPTLLHTSSRSLTRATLYALTLSTQGCRRALLSLTNQAFPLTIMGWPSNMPSDHSNSVFVCASRGTSKEARVGGNVMQGTSTTESSR